MNVTDFTFIFDSFSVSHIFGPWLNFTAVTLDNVFYSLHCRNKISTMTKQGVVDEPLQSLANGDNTDEKESIW